MLAYRGFLIDQTDPDDPGTWKPTWVGNNAGVDHYTMLRSKGSIGEYVLSVGANINNKISSPHCIFIMFNNENAIS